MKVPPEENLKTSTRIKWPPSHYTVTRKRRGKGSMEIYRTPITALQLQEELIQYLWRSLKSKVNIQSNWALLIWWIVLRLVLAFGTFSLKNVELTENKHRFPTWFEEGKCRFLSLQIEFHLKTHTIYN